MSHDARAVRAESEAEVFGTHALEGLVAELAAALGARRYEAFGGLAVRVTRSVIADPDRSRSVLGPASIAVDEIVFALYRTDVRVHVPREALLAIVDLINAFEVVGAPLTSTCRVIARSWLGELVDLGPPAAHRWRVGLAALAFGDRTLARRIAARPDITPYRAGRQFGPDVQAILAHVIAALDVDDGEYAALPALVNLVDLYGLAHAAGDLDEVTLLWLARVVYYDLGLKPVGSKTPSTRPPIGTVAAAARKLVWGIADDQVAAAAAGPVEESKPERPLTATLGAGAFRVDEFWCVGGCLSVCLGHRIADGARVLISCNYYPRHDLEKLASSIAYASPGVLELAFVGRLDGPPKPHGPIAAVELIPPGEWLPRLVPRERAIDVRAAVSLGLSMGEILTKAAATGILLTHVRPDLTFARRTGNGFAVTGLSARSHAVFSKKAGDAPYSPVFDRAYYAPETIRSQADDRSLVFSLAVMIAEWAIGHYPFKSLWYDNAAVSGKHLPLDLPIALADLLSRGMRADPTQRPHLATFLAELAPWELDLLAHSARKTTP